jgi:hypothetical protein
MNILEISAVDDIYCFLGAAVELLGTMVSFICFSLPRVLRAREGEQAVSDYGGACRQSQAYWTRK